MPQGPKRGADVKRWAGLVLFGAALIAGGCSTEASEETPPELSTEEYNGVSLEEIQTEAEPMSLEEAERLGIVDTTISVVPPMDPDSVDQPLIIPQDTTAAP